jgi:hypothetical protein
MSARFHRRSEEARVSTTDLFLLSHPLDMPPYTLILYQRIFGVETLCEFLFSIQVVDAVVALFANVDATLSHLVLAILLNVPLSTVDGPGYEMVFG